MSILASCVPGPSSSTDWATCSTSVYKEKAGSMLSLCWYIPSIWFMLYCQAAYQTDTLEWISMHLSIKFLSDDHHWLPKYREVRCAFQLHLLMAMKFCEKVEGPSACLLS